MVPDDSKTIRERAIAAWPPAWHGQNLRDMLTSLGHDVDRPWRDLPKKDRDWILFTDEQPVVPVYVGYNVAEARRAIKRKEEPSYQGNFSSARRYVLHTFANTENATIKKRVSQYMVSTACPDCHGKRLRRESLSVTFEGYDIADISRLPLKQLTTLARPYAEETAPALRKLSVDHPEKAVVAQRISEDLLARLSVLLDLGLGYLQLDRSTPTLSPGELQRLRLATQVRSNLFGVVYVLDEPSAGLHPADTESLLRALDRLKTSGNSLFVVEHELDVICHADWIVDIGPGAGTHGGWHASKPREAVILRHALCRANHQTVKPNKKWAVSSLPTVERRHDAILDPSAVAGIHNRYYKVDTQSIGFSGGSSLGIDSRGPKIALGSPGQNPYVSIL